MFSASTTDLYFPKPHNRIITNTVKFTNNTGVDAVIKMRTTSREKFHVRPRLFPLANGASIEVLISNRSVLNATTGSSSAAAIGSNSETPGGVGTTEIADTDECHAVVHRIVSASSSAEHNSESKIDSSSSLEQLQLAWDQGNNVGRVILKCRIADPPPSCSVSFATPQPRLSKSPSLPRVGSLDGGNGGGGSGGLLDRSLSGLGGGLPPLAGSGHHRTPSRGLTGSNDAVAQFSRDTDVRVHRRALSNGGVKSSSGSTPKATSAAGNTTNSSSSGVSGGGAGGAGSSASLETVADRVQFHEQALEIASGKLGNLSSAANAASVAVSRRMQFQEESTDALLSSSSSGRQQQGIIKQVPLSVTVFCMIVSFILGVMLRQSAQVAAVQEG